jgi:hypothetical protein
MDHRNRTPLELATVFATLIVGVALLIPACGEHITEFTPAGDAGTSCGTNPSLCAEASTPDAGADADAGTTDAGPCPSPGTIECGGECVVTRFDPRNCGACGASCSLGQVCAEGSCALVCPPGTLSCNGGCVDPRSNPQFCGATSGCGVGSGTAGTTCPSAQACSNGRCAGSCGGGLLDCGGECVDPLTSRTHCGASGSCSTLATTGTACAAGLVCSGGQCALSCQTGLVDCAGTCIDPATSRSHCGATLGCGIASGVPGTSCAGGQICSGGSCVLSCPSSLVECNGTCIDPLTSPTNCGATAGCGVLSGFPGTLCPPQQACSNAACCGGGLVNCGGTCVDPLLDAAHCGAFGTCVGPSAGMACGGGQICAFGGCFTPTTATYDILTSGSLVNIFGPGGNGCSGSGEYQNNCAAPFGFSWTDTGSGPVLAVSVDFLLQGSCAAAGTQHAVTLNGVLVGSFANTLPGCSCSTQSVTLTPFTLAPYVVGGTNTLLISSSTCEGLNNQSGVLATVSVQY